MSDGERWRWVVGFEDYYEVSDLGNVRSVDRVVPHARFGERFIRGRSIKQSTSTSGQLSVALAQDGRSFYFSVGRLVLEAFDRPPVGDEWAAHINGDYADNRRVNLAWTAPVGVSAMREGRGLTSRGEAVTISRLSEADVSEIRALWLTGEWTLPRLAERFGVCHTTCNHVTSGKTWGWSDLSDEVDEESRRRMAGFPPLGSLARRCLDHIEQHPGSTQGTMSAAFGKRISNLGALHAAGLVERWKAPEVVPCGAQSQVRMVWHYSLSDAARLHTPERPGTLPGTPRG